MRRQKSPILPFLLLSLVIHLGLLALVLNLTPDTYQSAASPQISFEVEKVVKKEAVPPLEKHEPIPVEKPKPIPGKPFPKGEVDGEPVTTPEEEGRAAKAPGRPAQPPADEVPRIQPPEITAMLKDREEVTALPKMIMPSYEDFSRYIDEYATENPEKSADVVVSFGVSNEGIKYISVLTRMYQRTWKNWIDKYYSDMVLRYPNIVRAGGLTGVVDIFIVYEKDGKLSHSAIVKSSEHKILDDIALEALLETAPFEPIPEEYDIERFRILCRFIYN